MVVTPEKRYRVLVTDMPDIPIAKELGHIVEYKRYDQNDDHHQVEKETFENHFSVTCTSKVSCGLKCSEIAPKSGSSNGTVRFVMHRVRLAW